MRGTYYYLITIYTLNLGYIFILSLLLCKDKVENLVGVLSRETLETTQVSKVPAHPPLSDSTLHPRPSRHTSWPRSTPTSPSAEPTLPSVVSTSLLRHHSSSARRCNPPQGLSPRTPSPLVPTLVIFSGVDRTLPTCAWLSPDPHQLCREEWSSDSVQWSAFVSMRRSGIDSVHWLGFPGSR